MGYIICPIPTAYCMLGLLACSEAYESGQLGTGLSCMVQVLHCSKGGDPELPES